MSPGSLPRNPAPMPLQRMMPRTTIAIPIMTRNFPNSGTIQSWSAIRLCRANAPLIGRRYDVRAAHTYSVIPSASEGTRRWSWLTQAKLCIDTHGCGIPHRLRDSGRHAMEAQNLVCALSGRPTGKSPRPNDRFAFAARSIRQELRTRTPR